MIRCGRMLKRRLRQVLVRAWTVDVSDALDDLSVDPILCTAALYSESGLVREVAGEVDPAGALYVRFALPEIALRPGEAYFIRVSLAATVPADLGTRDFFFGTT